MTGAPGNLKPRGNIFETAAAGAFQLFYAKVVARLLAPIGGLLLLRLLQPEQYGLMIAALVIPEILVMFTGFGIDDAVTRYLARLRQDGRYSAAAALAESGLLFKLGTALFLTMLSYFSAGLLARAVLHKPYLEPLIAIASLAIMSRSVLTFAQACMLGLDLTRMYSIVSVLLEALGVVLPVSLVLLGRGAGGALLGIILSSLVSGAVGIFAIISNLLKTPRGQGEERVPHFRALKEALSFGVPVWGASLARSALTRYYMFLAALFISPVDLGNYYAAVGLLAPLAFIGGPVEGVMYPLFSKVDSSSQRQLLQRTFVYSVKYLSLFVLPIGVSLMIMGRSLTNLLIPGYTTVWIYLTLLALEVILNDGTGASMLKRLLVAQGLTKTIAKLDLLAMAVGMILGFILIQRFGLIGLILSGYPGGITWLILAYRSASKRFGIHLPWRSLNRIYISTIITTFALLAVIVSPLDELGKVVVGVGLGLATYSVSLGMIDALDQNDIRNLEKAFTGRPIIGWLGVHLIRFIGRI